MRCLALCQASLSSLRRGGRRSRDRRSAALPVVPRAARGAAFAISLAGFFGRPAFQDRLARELDLAGLSVDVDDHDHDLVAHVDHVLDGGDAIVGQLRDVNHAVHAGQDLDKGAIALRADHLADVDLADLGLFGQSFDHGDGLLRAQRRRWQR